MQGRSRDTDSLFERAIGIEQHVFEPGHPALFSAMQEYARFLRTTSEEYLSFGISRALFA